ncbi:hypothetical protein Z945_2715 [Sulfitobacter noctilucae]|uniref:hypothetical protein n=1 Tax=Sulfitobacter noctilucae TaxID=1342302 RepID=UPI0004694A5C|nr:hypothetical protein [Sulfitobacter noctilucae]KIN61722.1 hypothetical protein Z945_2715 [Sulfitobacter noctilucae]
MTVKTYMQPEERLMQRTTIALMSGIAGVLLLITAVVIYFVTTPSTTMPSERAQKDEWLYQQAERYAPKIDRAVAKSAVGNGPLSFAGIETHPDDDRVDIIYTGPTKEFSAYANGLHGRPWDVMRMANFEIRKKLCKNFQSTPMKANNVLLVVGFRIGDDPIHAVPFNDDMCMLYI